MAHFLLFYDTAPDYLQRRGEFRDQHLQLAWAAAGRGELLLGGALSDPVDGAVLLFQGEDASVVEDFARKDPYVLNGLVREWKVRAWTTVVGKQAATPVRASSV
ncbi:MAG TPA: YciI-like protein [Stenotrophomonas sp.]